MILRKDKSCKKRYVVCVNVKLAPLEKVKNSIARDLKVLSGLLHERNRLPVWIKWSIPTKFFIKAIDYGLVKVMHIDE